MSGELADALIMQAVLSAPGGLRRYTAGSLLVAIDANTLAELQAAAINNVLLSAGPGTPPVFGKVTLTQHVSGILPVANGGLGVGTLTAGAVVLGNATGAVTTVAPGASGNRLTSDGTTWISAAPAANLSIVSNGSAIATAESVSSTTYTDLATVGPQLTITVGPSGILIVGVGAHKSAEGTGSPTYVDFSLSGGNTRAPSDITALVLTDYLATAASKVTQLTNLTAAATTVTVKYRASTTVNRTFSNRNLWAMTW